MAVSHETSPGSGVFWAFAFGDFHDPPPIPSPDPAIIAARWFGVQGEGHIVGGTWGRDLSLRALYRGYASYAALVTAFAADAAKVGALTGPVAIDGVSHGNGTLTGVRMTDRPMPDGKNGLWFAPAVLTWRLRQ